MQRGVDDSNWPGHAGPTRTSPEGMTKKDILAVCAGVRSRAHAMGELPGIGSEAVRRMMNQGDWSGRRGLQKWIPLRR